MSAGIGSRLLPFTKTRAKPFFPVCGVPIVQYGIDVLSSFGVREFVMNIHHLPNTFRKETKRLDLGRGEIHYSDETEVLLGSAGGIRNAMPFFNREPFFLVNADRIWNVNLEEVTKRHLELSKSKKVTLTLVIRKSAMQGGQYTEINLDEGTNLVNGFGEKKSDVYFYSGIAVADPEALLHLDSGKPSDFVKDVLKPAIECGKVGYYIEDSVWIDIDSPSLWRSAHECLMSLDQSQEFLPTWSDRLKKKNVEISESFWVERSCYVEDYEALELRGITYWGSSTTIRRAFEGASVAYGALPGHYPNRNFISMNGLVVDFSKGS